MANASHPDPTWVILLLVSLTMLPFLALMVTSFVKLSIVMNLSRQAMGLQQIPPNMVINGLAIILTCYLMAPTLQNTIHRIFEVNELCKLRKDQKNEFELPVKIKAFQNTEDNGFFSGFASSSNEGNGELQKLEENKAFFHYARQPITKFLTDHTPERQSNFFIKMATRLWPAAYTKGLNRESVLIAIPAFMLAELTAAFEIGFLIYLPFIAIDLVVSNILLAMGMMMVSPMTISLPFKLMLFVLVNGWSKLIEALLLTYV